MSESGADQLRRALTSLRDMRGRLEAAEGARTEPIAIVGMGCRLPGADSPDEFWELLRRGDDAIVETPADRWDADGIYDPEPDASGKVATRWGGFLRDIDRFDASFFGISPREAAQMDPQQRLLLEVAWETLEDGGVPVERLAGSPTGVFVGVHSHSNDYYLLQAAEQRGLDLYSGTGTSHSVVSGRLSYLLDLRGPSIAIDTACSSSLVAVHLAVQSLRNRECAAALAAGVNSIIDPTFTMVASRMRMMSPSGRCRPFDAAGDGFVRSEGCGAVLLKRLSDAVADGDRIHAVIHGSAVNQDGRSNGLTAPNSLSQEAVIEAALANARLSPEAVGYVEAHGTGTPLGDPIEIEALTAVVGAGDPGTNPCLLGSAKANIGHCEGAAGIAGLIKAALTVRSGEVPPLVHFDELNPHISLEGTRFVIPTSPTPWHAGDEPRRAGVSSFGWSGTNVHLIVGEAPPEAVAEPIAPDERPLLLALSARSAEALRDLAVAYRDLLDDAPSSAAAVCAGAALRRSHHGHRLAVAARTADDLVDQLGAFVDGEPRRQTAIGSVRPDESPPIVFVCPGQGSQWPGMARQLLATEPTFRDQIERCARALEPHVEWSLIEQLEAGSSAGHDIDDIDVIQPTLFAIQVALAALWRAFGVRPDAVVGHSMGEVAAAHIAGALSLDDAARVICVRSALLRRISGDGAMAVVELDVAGAEEAIRGLEHRLSVAVSNSASSSVLSGDPGALDEVMARLEADDVFCRRVKVDVASHSPQVDPLLDELVDRLAGLTPTSSVVPFVSTVTTRFEDGVGLDARYWADNLRRPVRFGDSVRALAESGHRCFVELSPHPVLLSAIAETLEAADVAGTTIATFHRDADEPLDFCAALGALYAAGRTPDWEVVHRRRRAATELPTYAWQRERHWLETPTGGATGRRGPQVDPLLGWVVPVADEHAARVWENALERRDLPQLYQHRIGGQPSLPASALLELMFRAGESGDVRARGLTDVRFELLTGLDDDAPTPLQVVLDPTGPGTGAISLFTLAGDRWIRHASATIGSPAPIPAARAVAVLPDAPVSDGAARYRDLADDGVELGTALRSIQALRRDGSTVVADVVAAAPVDDQLVMFDSCLQAAAFAALDPADPAEGALFMPISASAAWRDGTSTPTMTAVVTDRVDEATPATRTVDVALYDDGGRPVAALEGLVLQRLDTAAARPDDWFYGIEWRPVPEPTDAPDDETDDETGAMAPAAGTWLVLADAAGHGRALAAELRSSGARCVVVTRGERADRPGPDEQVIDASGRHDLRNDLRAVLDEVGGDVDEHGLAIAFLWGLDGPAGDPRSAAELADAQATGCVALGALVGAMTESGVSTRITVVTKGVHRVVDDDGGAAVSQSTLWGLGRAIAEELPDAWGGLVDLDPADDETTAAATLARSLLAAPTDAFEGEVALRGGTRYVARLVRTDVPPPAPLDLRSDATYLVTGGFGALGAEVATWLVGEGARRLILLGRTELPPRRAWSGLDPDTPQGRRVALVRRLEQLGAAVHVASVDVGDEHALGEYLASFREEGWPPVRGVFHTAAVLGGQLVDRLDPDELLGELRPKVVGTWSLAEQLDDLDHLVLYSSIGALLPMAGQGGYAAGNAFLDAFANRRRALGRSGLSVNWGFWDGSAAFRAGEVGQRRADGETGFKDAARVMAEARGMRGFRPEQGLEALGRLLRDRCAQAVVLPIDWAAFGAAQATRPVALATDLVREQPATADGDPADRPPTLAERFGQLDDEGRAELVTTVVRRSVGSILRLPESRIDDRQPFGGLGLDSLMAIELRNALEAEVGFKLSATMAWNYPTVAELSAYVLAKLGGTVHRPDPDGGSTPAPGDDDIDHLAATVADLDDDEALRALMGRGTS